MSKYAIVAANGVVVNVVNWDGSGNWIKPVGTQAIQHDTAGPGWTYHAGQFFAPDAEQPTSPVLRIQIYKSVVLSRLTDEQLDSALAAMTNRQKERWRAPDAPTVFADDPEVIGLIQLIGANPAVVLAP